MLFLILSIAGPLKWCVVRFSKCRFYSIEGFSDVEIIERASSVDAPAVHQVCVMPPRNDVADPDIPKIAIT